MCGGDIVNHVKSLRQKQGLVSETSVQYSAEK